MRTSPSFPSHALPLSPRIHRHDGMITLPQRDNNCYRNCRVGGMRSASPQPSSSAKAACHARPPTTRLTGPPPRGRVKSCETTHQPVVTIGKVTLDPVSLTLSWLVVAGYWVVDLNGSLAQTGPALSVSGHGNIFSGYVAVRAMKIDALRYFSSVEPQQQW